jgi:hypothetical protein
VPITPAEFVVVPDWPPPGHRPTDREIESLGVWYGPHVPELVKTRRLQARRDDRGCWYFRPVGWRSLSIDEQTRRVVHMLNGDPSLEVA